MKNLHLFFLAVIVSVSCNNQDKTKLKSNKSNLDSNKNILKEPFTDIKIKNTTYNINTEKDTVLMYKTGTKINIPKHAFIDKNGNQVKGEVKLTYREFSNAFDIYLGGIPMTYESEGVEQVFETAGMMEINAYANQQPVFPNPQNKIEVEMNSFQTGEQYNVYQLDVKSGKWNNIGKDKVEIKDYNECLAALPEIPEAPKKAGLHSFSIGDETGKYPSLEMYNNVLFEPVDNSNCGFDATGIEVQDLGNGLYNVIFKLDAYDIHHVNKCKCYLAFKEGADYDNAMKNYQKKYKHLIAKRNKLKKELEKEWSLYHKAVKKYNLAILNNELSLLSDDEKVVRTLEINGFGFINCDSPTLYPQGAELTATYKDENNKDIVLKDVVLVEKGRNAIFRYTSKIKFNPQKENMLWGITTDNKLAYIKTNEFKEITKTDGDFTFSMKVHPQRLKTYDEICKVLF